MRLVVGGLCLLGLIWGGLRCTQYTFELRLPESVKEVNRVVPAVRPTPADILFIVDNSGSMRDEQENLARNFKKFIDVLAGSGGDYQIAVVTTDVDTNTQYEVTGQATMSFRDASRWYSGDFSQFAAHCCVDPKDRPNACASGETPSDTKHACVRGPNPGLRIIRSSQLSTEQQIAAFVANVQVGSCGSSNERGLEAMASALTKTKSDGCNAGFLREDANLVVVFVSDEEEHSPDAVSEFAAQLVAFKRKGGQDRTDKIRVAAIVGSKDGEASRCGSRPTCGGFCDVNPPPPQGSRVACSSTNPCQVSNEVCIRDAQGSPVCVHRDRQFWDYCWWCSYYNAPDCCSAESGSRYVAFAKQMETLIVAAVPAIPKRDCRPRDGERAACLIDSICQTEFDQTLIRIARDLVLTNEFALDPPANYPEGIVVVIKRNGQAVQKLVQCTTPTDTNCSFDVTKNAQGQGIAVKLRVAIQDGDELEIYYTIQETPT